MKRPRKPLKPLPPRPEVKRTLTEADLAAIREIMNAAADRIASTLRMVFYRASR